MTKYVNNNGVSEMWLNIKNWVTSQLLGYSQTGHTHSASDITSGLSTVATSGSYNDLSNKPTIPTVNNATLTIQKNGTTVNTFTANASSNVTANISVPTKTSDLTNDSNFITEDATKIPLSGTYNITGTYFFKDVNTSSIVISGGHAWNTGAYLGLSGGAKSENPGTFTLHACKTDGIFYRLVGYPNGTLTWGTKNVAMREDVIPRSGGSVITSNTFSRTVNDSSIGINGGNGWANGANITVYGKDNSVFPGKCLLYATDGTNEAHFWINPNGTASLNSKNLAMQEDTVPRRGGAVMTGTRIARTDNESEFVIGGGTGTADGAYIQMNGMGNANSGIIRMVPLGFNQTVIYKIMFLDPNGTWTWNGTACQITSDQRYKQQIDQIDDKLLDAWKDVEPVQFKYNDAVDQKGKDKARLHTGYVVQQIQKACESHGVDISAYGLYCHEEYPEETEEVEVEQKDGTKTKERKVIREASEHYSLRYTEALIVECKYLRRCIERLVARIEELEKGNNIK